jgi:arylsulfatase A-like enzyme
MKTTAPNILAICLDQIRWDWFSLHGHPLVRTPHMDSIGGRGVSFTRAFSQCPTCIPARQTLMTGLDPWGIQMFANKGTQPFPAGRPRLADCLAAAGYQTHAVGKLHCYPGRDRIGFHEAETDEEYRVYEDGTLHDYLRYLQEKGLAKNHAAHGVGPNQYGWRIDSIPEEHSPTHWVAERACTFLQRRDPLRPFFLYASFRQPHPPFVVQPAFWEMYRDREVPMPVLGDWCEAKQPNHWKALHLKHRTNLWWEHPHEIPDNGLEMLFDHDNDPREAHDLSEKQEHRATRDRMRALLRDHLARNQDRHVVQGELTVQPPPWAVEDSRFGDKGMHRGIG